MINHEIIKYNDDLYFVYRKFKQSQIKEDKINELMKLLDCNLVLKKTEQEPILFYLKKIPELELIN